MSYDLDAKIAEYYALNPLRFPIVKSISFTQGVDPLAETEEMQQQLSLVLAKDESFDGECFHLELFGVRNFLFEQPPQSLFNLYLNIAKNVAGSDCDSRFTCWNSEQDVKFVCSFRDFVAAIAENRERSSGDGSRF